MTAITLLNGDFEILFEDETVGGNAVAGLKLVRRTATASDTVYTTNALYSAIADASDEFQAMDFENPMLPVTPNAYTMENDYFISRASTEFLEEGAISMDWSNEIRSITYSTAGSPGINFVTGDIGRQVVGGTSGDTGTLLDFEVLPDGILLAWIRPDDPTPVTGDIFDVVETLSVTADGGTGFVQGLAASSTGEQLYSSVQVIGSVPTATEVYLIQDRQKMTDAAGAFQWWATDPAVSLGIIDILIRVTRDSVDVADGDVEVFGRRYTSLYDNFRLNVVAGGRSALPLASAPDINNTTGYRVFTAAGTSTGTWTVGNGIYVGADWATATARGVVTAATTGASAIIEYYLVGDLTDLANGNAAKEYDFTTGLDGDATVTVVTPTANPGGPTDVTAGGGGTVTITPGTTTVDHDGDATAEPYSVTVDAQGDVSAANVYERIKYVTRRGQDNTFWSTIVPNVPGETYRGLEVQAQYITPVGTFDQGDNVDVVASGFTGRNFSVNVTDTYVMLSDQQTSIRPLASGDVLRDAGGVDTVTIDGAPDQFTSPKSSPFGTFTGSQIFGARGVVYINPHTSDTQSYILTDDNGTQRTPPNTVSFVVNNTVAGDRVLVARDTGTDGIINKDQFGGLDAPDGSPAVNGLGDQTIRAAGTIDSEVPQTGFVRVVETTLQEEHHYEYSSRVSGLNGTFTLTSIPSGTITTGSAAGSPLGGHIPGEVSLLIDSAVDFTALGVQVGMLVRNTTGGKTTHVWEVVEVGDGSPFASDTLTVRPLYGPLDITQDWDIGNTYEINRLIGDHTVPTGYAVTDNMFDLIIDQEAITTTSSNTFVKILSTPFDTVVNVRQGKVILPFTQNAAVGDSGATVSVVRAADTIAT